MNSIIYLADSVLENNNTIPLRVPKPLLIFSKVYSFAMTVLSNLFFGLLICYKLKKRKRKRKSSKKLKFVEHERLIFKQLYYIAAYTLVFSDLCVVFRVFSGDDNDNWIQLICSASLLFVEHYFDASMELVFAVITVFSFLAVFQKLIVLKAPNMMWLVSGFLLEIQVGLVYVSLIIFAVILYQCDWKEMFNFEFKCTSSDLRNVYFLCNNILTLMTIVSCGFYIYVYKVLGKFTEQESSKRSMLYRFLPIYLFQLIHNVTVMTLGIFEKLHMVTKLHEIVLVSYMFLAPWIPVIVSVSYVGSKENVQSLKKLLRWKTRVHSH